MNWIKKIFGNKDSGPHISPNPHPEWIELEKHKPPHEVVLAACDTYDCGWILNTAWWNEKDECWMTTGGIQSEKAHLPYSHWRKLPSAPDGQ